MKMKRYVWLNICLPSQMVSGRFDTKSFRYKSFLYNSKSIRYPSKVILMHAKSLFHTKLFKKRYPVAVWNYHRISTQLELPSDTGWFVPLWGSSDFPLNQAGFREEVQHIQLAEKVPRPPDKRFRCTLGSIQHGRQVTRNNVLVSYNNWSANQRNYSGDVYFMKWILIGKAEYVHGKWFFGSIISKSR